MLRNTCSLVSGCGNLSSSESVDGSISSLGLSPCNDSDSSKLVAIECVLQKHGLLGYTAVNVWQEEANMWKSHLKFRDTTTLHGSLWEFSLLFVLKMLEKNIPCASRWWHLFKLWKNHDQEFTKKKSNFKLSSPQCLCTLSYFQCKLTLEYWFPSWRSLTSPVDMRKGDFRS